MNTQRWQLLGSQDQLKIMIIVIVLKRVRKRIMVKCFESRAVADQPSYLSSSELASWSYSTDIKSNNIQYTTMSYIFGITPFRQPEQFYASYLGFHTHKPQLIHFLSLVIKRMKNPPLALSYTHQFLQEKSEEERGLDLIRFVSQLADISSGVSVSSSLYNIIGESSFLTELRHSLTHKTMAKGTLIQLSKHIVLKELKEKFWDVVAVKLREIYYLDTQKVKKYYREIFSIDFNGQLQAHNHPNNYFETCSNYEFKEWFCEKIMTINLPELQIIFDRISIIKKSVMVAILFQKYVFEPKNQNLAPSAFYFAQNCPQQILRQNIVLYEIKKIFFFSYLDQNRKLFSKFKSGLQQYIKKYWEEKQVEMGKGKLILGVQAEIVIHNS